jgi:hypothetical protein
MRTITLGLTAVVLSVAVAPAQPGKAATVPSAKKAVESVKKDAKAKAGSAKKVVKEKVTEPAAKKTSEKKVAAKPVPAKKAAPKKAEASAAPSPAPAASGRAAGAASGVKVPEAVVCAGIENRQPQGAAEEFTNDVGKLYFFTRITGVTGTADFQHRWYLNDALVSTVTLTVKAASWRTWSSKSVSAGSSGSWKVEVVEAESGAVLASVPFTVN